MKNRLLIITGEVSGDLHGGNLAKFLLESCPYMELAGIGGENMARAGVKILFPSYKLSIIGLSGIARRWLSFLKAYRLVMKELTKEGLTAVVFIDFPGFNLFLTQKAKQAGIPVIYYIGPQVWAWRKSRLKKIAARVDLMLVILPFEEDIFKKAGIKAEFVGHPLADIIHVERSRQEICRDYNFEVNQPIIGLLPGSRQSEIESLLPVMLKASKEILKDIQKAQFFVLKAPGLGEMPPPGQDVSHRSAIGLDNRDYSSPSIIERILKAEGFGGMKVIPKTDYDLMAQADFLIIASGTATLEAAMLGVPFIIVYLTDRLTYFLAKHLVQIRYIGLINIIAERLVVPELLQDHANPQAIAKWSLRFLLDKAYSESIRKELQCVCQSINRKGVSQRAAKKIIEFLSQSGSNY